MAQSNNNPPDFPTGEGALYGMTLRDYFAGLAMQAIGGVWCSVLATEHRNAMLRDWIKRYGESVQVDIAIARDAYETADAMIAVREEKEVSNG